MPTLNWIGKDKVINHHLDVPWIVVQTNTARTSLWTCLEYQAVYGWQHKDVFLVKP